MEVPMNEWRGVKQKANTGEALAEMILIKFMRICIFRGVPKNRFLSFVIIEQEQSHTTTKRKFIPRILFYSNNLFSQTKK